MKKDMETLNKNQSEVKNTISEMENTVEGIKCRLDEAKDWISDLEDKVERTPNQSNKEKKDLKGMRIV